MATFNVPVAAVGGGAVPLRTVTVTLRLPVLPAASRTDAVSTRLPSATLLVFHAIITGPVEAVGNVATVWPATLSVRPWSRRGTRRPRRSPSGYR